MPNSLWETPDANLTFIPGLCDYSQHFDARQIVFDSTFCVRVFRSYLLAWQEDDRTGFG